MYFARLKEISDKKCGINDFVFMESVNHMYVLNAIDFKTIGHVVTKKNS